MKRKLIYSTKNRVLTFIIGLLLTIPAFAENEVTMVSYEQSWSDYEGRLAVKNNTSSDIHNLTFRITYFDMKGNQLDYEEFTEEEDIAPGMTKKLSIRAYEGGRDYYYYKTNDGLGRHPFKVQFQLLSYNDKTVSQSASGDTDFSQEDMIPSDDYDSSSDRNFFTIGLIAIAVFLSVTVGLYILVAVMAKQRRRSVVAWILVSFIGTPLLSAIILLVIGDADDGYTPQDIQ